MRLPWRRQEPVPETRSTVWGAMSEAAVFSPWDGPDGSNHPVLAGARAFVGQVAGNLRIDPLGGLDEVPVAGFPDLPALIAWTSVRAMEGERIVIKVERRGGRISRLSLVKPGAARWTFDSQSGVDRLTIDGRAPAPHNIISVMDPSPQRSQAMTNLVEHASRIDAAMRASTRDLGGTLVLKREMSASPFDAVGTSADTSVEHQTRLDEWSRNGVVVLPPGITAFDRVPGDEQGASLMPQLRSLAQECSAFFGVPEALLLGQGEPAHLRVMVAVVGERLSRMWQAALAPALGVVPEVTPQAIKVSDPVQIEALRVSQVISTNEARLALGLPRHEDPAADNPLQPVTGTAQPRRGDQQG